MRDSTMDEDISLMEEDISKKESSKKTKAKKKEVSLSDQEYEELFRAVLLSTDKSDEEGSENVNSNACKANSIQTHSKKSVHNTCNVSSNKSQGQENKITLSNKIVPKFNAPGKRNVLTNITNVSQNKSKKFVPPTPNILIQTKPLQASKNNKSQAENTKENGASKKSQKTFSAHTEQEKEKTMLNNNKEAATKKSKKDNHQTHTTYKEADSTEHTHSNNKQMQNGTVNQNSKVNENKSAIVKNVTESIIIKKKQNETFTNESEGSEESSDDISSDEELPTNGIAKSYELSQASNGSLILNQSFHTQLSQPPPEFNQRQRLEWLRIRRDVGVWVQCCRVHCSKWRYLEHIKDPVTIPDYWVCSMNNDPRYNSCEKPERGPRLNEQMDLINNKYTAGSLVWAHIDGFPWWPALVDDDPDIEAYYWLNGFSDIPTHYHVVFFDEKEVSRAWVTPGNIHPFTGAEKQKKFNVKYFKGINYCARITAAKEQAKLAYTLSLKERLEQYGFLARYKGPIGEKKKFKGKNQRKVSSDSHPSSQESSYDSDENNITLKRKKSRKTEKNASKKKKGSFNEVSLRLKEAVENKNMKHCYKTRSSPTSGVIKKGKLQTSERECCTKIKNVEKTRNGSCSPMGQPVEETDEEAINNLNENNENEVTEYSCEPNDETPEINEIAAENNVNKSTVENNVHEYISAACTEEKDPFEDEKYDQINQNNLTNYELNTDGKGETASCSHLATVGTGLRKSSNEILKNIQKQILDSCCSLTPPGKLNIVEIERQEADTSQDVTDISRNFINPFQAGCENIDRDTQSQSIQLPEIHTCNDQSDAKDAIVPQMPCGMVNDEEESDPFEEDD